MEILKIFKSNRLPSLDGLRFLAALLVIFGHGGLPLPAGDGVTYFFVLSGMLFSWMFQKEWDKNGKIDFKGFYLRRTFRILPAFYVAIVFTILGKIALHLPINFFHAISAATFTGNYYNAFHNHPATGFDMYWSLGVEEQFYLIWPLCFVFFMKKGPKALLNFLIIAIILVCIWRTILALGFNVESPYLYNAFDTRFDSLALGCLMGLLVMSPKFTPTLQIITKTGFHPLLPIMGIILCNYISLPFHYSIGLTIQALLMSIFIVQVVILHDNLFWKWLNHRWLVFLGTLSYSTYLYHAWGLSIAGKIIHNQIFVKVCVGLLMSVMLALGSYYLVEQPFLKLRKNIF